MANRSTELTASLEFRVGITTAAKSNDHNNNNKQLIRTTIDHSFHTFLELRGAVFRSDNTSHQTAEALERSAARSL